MWILLHHAQFSCEYSFVVTTPGSFVLSDSIVAVDYIFCWLYNGSISDAVEKENSKSSFAWPAWDATFLFATDRRKIWSLLLIYMLLMEHWVRWRLRQIHMYAWWNFLWPFQSVLLFCKLTDHENCRMLLYPLASHSCRVDLSKLPLK